jgi:hypothetical protein
VVKYRTKLLNLLKAFQEMLQEEQLRGWRENIPVIWINGMEVLDSLLHKEVFKETSIRIEITLGKRRKRRKRKTRFKV